MNASPSRTQSLDVYCDRLARAAEDDAFVSSYEEFLRGLAQADFVVPEGPDDPAQASAKAFLTGCQRRYLAIKEREAHACLMAGAEGRWDPDSSHLMHGFGRASYERVSDLKKLVDFSACRRVVMVGCGAFPATLLWLNHNFPALRSVGLDVDENAAALAAELAAAVGMENISVRVADGTNYDFSSADFVYIANQVTPKRTILARIAAFPSVVRVVVREPTARGMLLSETVRPDLPSAFAVESKGRESSAFLSYDLCLRRVVR